MALYKTNDWRDNCLIVAVFTYAIVSMVWAAHSLFQEHTSWVPWVNLFLALLACIGLGLKLVCDLASDVAKTYEELDEQEKEKIHRVGKRLGKTVFSLIKERRGRIGNFCRKWDEAK